MTTRTTRYLFPTDVDFYADHDADTLRSIVDRKTADSLHIALAHGADHPLVTEALKIANAAWGALALRGILDDMSDGDPGSDL